MIMLLMPVLPLLAALAVLVLLAVLVIFLPISRPHLFAQLVLPRILRATALLRPRLWAAVIAAVAVAAAATGAATLAVRRALATQPSQEKPLYNLNVG